MRWPLRQLPHRFAITTSSHNPSPYLTEMMRLAEDGVMFTIAGSKTIFVILRATTKSSELEHDPDDLLITMLCIKG